MATNDDKQPTSTKVSNEHKQATPNVADLVALNEKLMARLEKMEHEAAVVKSTIDQSVYNAANARINPDQRPLVRLRQYDDKIITSWDKMPKNDVRIINGQLVENQEVVLHYLDGTTETVSYKAYADGVTLTPQYPVNGRREKGNEVFITVELPDREIEVELTFLN